MLFVISKYCKQINLNNCLQRSLSNPNSYDPIIPQTRKNNFQFIFHHNFKYDIVLWIFTLLLLVLPRLKGFKENICIILLILFLESLADAQQLFHF